MTLAGAAAAVVAPALWARRGIKVGSMVMPSRPAPPRSSAHNDHPVAAMTSIDTSVSIVEPP